MSQFFQGILSKSAVLGHWYVTQRASFQNVYLVRKTPSLHCVSQICLPDICAIFSKIKSL